MKNDNKKKSTRNHKKEGGKYRSKNIKHDPQNESSRAIFGLNGIDTESKK